MPPMTVTSGNRLSMLMCAAADEATSLDKRLRFLDRFSAELDDLCEAGEVPDPADPVITREAAVVYGSLLPALAARGWYVRRFPELQAPVRQALATLFTQRILPLLTPLAFDATHPFPRSTSLSVNLAVTWRDDAVAAERYATVALPRGVPRLLEAGRGSVVPLEELVASQLTRVFGNVTIVSARCFRVSRRSGRGFPPATRLELERAASPDLAAALMHGLELDGNDKVHRPPNSLLMGAPLAELGAVLVASSARTTTAARAATRPRRASGARRRPGLAPAPPDAARTGTDAEPRPHRAALPTTPGRPARF